MSPRLRKAISIYTGDRACVRAADPCPHVVNTGPLSVGQCWATVFLSCANSPNLLSHCYLTKGSALFVNRSTVMIVLPAVFWLLNIPLVLVRHLNELIYKYQLVEVSCISTSLPPNLWTVHDPWLVVVAVLCAVYYLEQCRVSRYSNFKVNRRTYKKCYSTKNFDDSSVKRGSSILIWPTA